MNSHTDGFVAEPRFRGSSLAHAHRHERIADVWIVRRLEPSGAADSVHDGGDVS